MGTFMNPESKTSCAMCRTLGPNYPINEHLHQRVEVNYQGNGKYFSAMISGPDPKRRKNHIGIKYDDHPKPLGTPYWFVRLLAVAAPSHAAAVSPSFQPGQPGVHHLDAEEDRLDEKRSEPPAVEQKPAHEVQPADPQLSELAALRQTLDALKRGLDIKEDAGMRRAYDLRCAKLAELEAELAPVTEFLTACQEMGMEATRDEAKLALAESESNVERALIRFLENQNIVSNAPVPKKEAEPTVECK